MKRIGIDARFFGSARKGLGRYTQKLIENLEKIDFENEYFVFLCRENFDEYSPQNSNFKKVLADFKWYGIKEQFLFPILLYKYSLDLMHFPHFNVPLLYLRPLVVTIHDLILLHFPTLRGTTLSPLWYGIKFLAYKLTIKSAINRAKVIISVSKFTKNDILHHYHVQKEKIVVIYESADDFCRITQESEDVILKKYGIIKPYLLYVGNAYPHKNLEKIINVFNSFKENKPEYSLVLVGKEDYFYNRLKEYVKKNKMKGIIFPGHVPDEYLDNIYRASALYVFPSLYEGFGLPPLEAMLKGVPVLSSDHKCMKEILGNSAFFCDARDDKALLLGINKVLNDVELKKNLIQNGYKKSGSYSWKKMAKDTLDVYENIK